MIRVRFAPSPTGFLHLGNARTALFNYMFAKANKGAFILRIEDTDRERSREEYTAQLMEDLKWLGIRWDEGPDAGGPYGPYKQSERLHIYKEYLDKLFTQGAVYKCFCTEKELEERRQIAILAGRPPRYDNRCRALTEGQVKSFQDAGREYVIRFKVPENTRISFNDVIRGRVEQDSSLLGDFVIARPDGIPSFHFAVVTDDALMKVTHVIRGEDHLSNTFLHLLLFKALGFEPPQYAHMSLTKGADGALLSKRHGVTSIKDFRDKGYMPEAVANCISLLGWSAPDKKELFRIDDIADAFKIDHLSKSPSVFDLKKLDWIAAEHMKLLSAGELSLRIAARGLFMPQIDGVLLHRLIDDIKGGASTLNGLHAGITAILGPLAVTDGLKSRLSQDPARKVLSAFAEKTEKAEYFDRDTFDRIIGEIAEENPGLKKRDIFVPLRLAVTGTDRGPDMHLLMEIFGKTGCLDRLKNFSEKV
ncbi:MAG: glutamate--tRNA ligase [Planctomycetes bacterium]|nr:glutamate--tRNA ligase [Planctomycetota bacterium]